MSGQDQIASIEREALERLAAVSDETTLEGWFREYLGRRDGKITGLLRLMGGLAQDERPRFGAAVNEAKDRVTVAYEERKVALGEAALQARLAAEAIDITLPGRPVPAGTLHPTTMMIRELSEIYALMGFQTIEGSRRCRRSSPPCSSWLAPLAAARYCPPSMRPDPPGGAWRIVPYRHWSQLPITARSATLRLNESWQRR